MQLKQHLFHYFQARPWITQIKFIFFLTFNFLRIFSWISLCVKPVNKITEIRSCKGKPL